MVGSLRRAGLAKVRRLRERGEEEGRVGREWEPQISPRHAGTGPLRYAPVEKHFQGGDGVKRSQGLKASSVHVYGTAEAVP
jgi:hypothetical protein